MNNIQVQPNPNLRSGYVLKYDASKSVGVIFCEGERYFFHRDRIIQGPVHPDVNARVLFLPGKRQEDAPFWKFAPAFSIIVLDEAGFAALAEPSHDAQDEKVSR
jgi:hypothetical protein